MSEPQLGAWTSQIEARYREVEATRGRDGSAAGSFPVAPGERFVATASSFTLGAIFGEDEVHTLLDLIAAGPAGAWIRGELGPQLACDLDQAWVRRQYPPGKYPPLHAPHGWHQDGALGFDFLAEPGGMVPPEAVLPMATCWIALNSCGQDAPGLELVRPRLNTLLAPAELADERVRGRFAPEDFWRPTMEPGDALLFRGDILHRTYVTPLMTRQRTSLELRFFQGNNLPARLQGGQRRPRLYRLRQW